MKEADMVKNKVGDNLKTKLMIRKKILRKKGKPTVGYEITPET